MNLAENVFDQSDYTSRAKMLKANRGDRSHRSGASNSRQPVVDDDQTTERGQGMSFDDRHEDFNSSQQLLLGGLADAIPSFRDENPFVKPITQAVDKPKPNMKLSSKSQFSKVTLGGSKINEKTVEHSGTEAVESGAPMVDPSESGMSRTTSQKN